MVAKFQANVWVEFWNSPKCPLLNNDCSLTAVYPVEEIYVVCQKRVDPVSECVTKCVELHGDTRRLRHNILFDAISMDTITHSS